MNSQRPTFGFLGNPSGPLAKQVSGHVNLVSFSGSLASGQHGLLIDGTTASKLDQSSLASVLKSDGLLALTDPTAEHAKLLRSITGQGPTGNVAMVSYKKASNRAGYNCVLVPYGQATSTVASDSTPVQKGPVAMPAAPLGQILVDAALETTELGIAPPGLVPPQGSLAGYSSFQSPCQWDPGYPNINGNYDDNTAEQNTQPINNQFLTEFFVYWVNGGNIPYYVAIVRQTGPMSIGSVLANNQDSRGWFNLYFQILPNSVNVNGTDMPSGVQLAAYTPQAGLNTQLPVAMQIPMTVNAKTQNGTGPVPFIATLDSLLDYANWGILDQTSGAKSAWQAYQTSGWNPVQYPPGDANTWWSNVYSNGNVVAMPDQSFGSIAFEMATCWGFDNSLFTAPGSPPFTPPPSMWVTFSGGWHQSPGFLHNHPGCHGAAGGQHFHIWGNDCTWTWSWDIDLASCVNNKNID